VKSGTRIEVLRAFRSGSATKSVAAMKSWNDRKNL